MACPQDNKILRLVGGELAGAEERDFRRHLAACPVCADALEALSSTWNDLGAWQIETRDADVVERVLGQAEAQEVATHTPTIMAVFTRGWLRIAASIALAAGLGIVTGTLVPPGRVAQDSASSAVSADDELINALGLDELATPSATRLPLAFEPVAAPNGEAES